MTDLCTSRVFEEAAVVYFLDHGKDIYADNPKICGHSFKEVIYSRDLTDKLMDDPDCRAEAKWFWEATYWGSRFLSYKENVEVNSSNRSTRNNYNDDIEDTEHPPVTVETE